MSSIAAFCYREALRGRPAVRKAAAAKLAGGGDNAGKKKQPKAKAKAKPDNGTASDAPPAAARGTVGLPPARSCPDGGSRPQHGTDKLYLDDTMLFSLAGAKLLGHADTVNADGQGTGELDLELDRTIFHPQGGGQPTDKGVIRSADQSAVFRVSMVKEDRGTGIVLHTGRFTSGSVEALQGAGAGLVLEIDGDWRVSCARIHSAGHALDVGMMALGYTIMPTKGYHFPEGPYVEYEARSAQERLSTEDKDSLPERLSAKMAELAAVGVADPAIEEVAVRFLKKDETLDLCPDADLRMFEAEDARVRVIRVGGQWIPCGGTHVSMSTIGKVTVTKAKAKKSTLKVSYVLEAMVMPEP